MDTRFLESFVAVVENGSMAEAARRLNLTPAAVAQRIHALEDDIGARLLARSGRAMRPTEAGAAILGRARHLVQDIRDLKSIASDETAGELRLGAVSTAISGMLPAVLKPMTARSIRKSRSTSCLERQRSSITRSSAAISMRH